MKKMLMILVMGFIGSAYGHGFDLSFNCEQVLKTEVELRETKSKPAKRAGGVLLLLVTGGMASYSMGSYIDEQKSLASKTDELLNALGVSDLSRKEIEEVMREEDHSKVLAAREESRTKMNLKRKYKLDQEQYDRKFPIEKDLIKLVKTNRIDKLVKSLRKASKINLKYLKVKNFLLENRDSDFFCQDNKAPTVTAAYLKKLARLIPRN